MRYGVPDKPRLILVKSGRWGGIKAEVICAISSKYAMTLYEMVQLRGNMDRALKTISNRAVPRAAGRVAGFLRARQRSPAFRRQSRSVPVAATKRSNCKRRASGERAGIPAGVWNCAANPSHYSALKHLRKGISRWVLSSLSSVSVRVMRLA